MYQYRTTISGFDQEMLFSHSLGPRDHRMNFFYCIVKFWTMPYGPKALWWNSQKVNFIEFKQGQLNKIP